jgi:putative hydrolase of the HAD superfamily
MGIEAIFCDVGGVFLTNGWDTGMRKAAAKHFEYDFDDAEKRHRLMYSTHELGKISLDTYLDFTFFNTPQNFTKEQYKEFMFAQSKPLEGMIDIIRNLKAEKGLRIGVVSNEGRELMEYRIKNWLKDFVDFFCVSAFVGHRKPDPTIFYLATDLAQVAPNKIAYIDDRAEFAEMATDLGLKGLHHTSTESTEKKLRGLL